MGWMVWLGLLAVIAGVWLFSRPKGRARRSAAGAAGWDPLRPAMPSTYSPVNVGNDASARPWERSTMTFEAEADVDPQQPGASLDPRHDPGAFLQRCKTNFVSLQDAWERSDRTRLGQMMTPDMLQQIEPRLNEREQAGPPGQGTGVDMLEAKLIDVEADAGNYLANVEFSGLLREAGSAGPSPFREIWSIRGSLADASAWQVAGLQALQ